MSQDIARRKEDERSVRDLDVIHSSTGTLKFRDDETGAEVSFTPQEGTDPETRRAIARRLDVLWKYTPDAPTREIVRQLTLGRTLKGDIERQEQEKRELRQQRDALREACRKARNVLMQAGEASHPEEHLPGANDAIEVITDALVDVQPEAAEGAS